MFPKPIAHLNSKTTYFSIEEQPVNIEPPKASITKSTNKGKTVFQYTYDYFWVPPLENGPSPKTALDGSSCFDASAPCSWNLTATYGRTTGGEFNP